MHDNDWKPCASSYTRFSGHFLTTLKGLDRGYIGIYLYIHIYIYNPIGVILGLHKDNGQENGNYYIIL